MKKRLSHKDTKNIIIRTIGPITVMGNISGPILKPFKVKVSDIMHLVVTKYDVVEILDDGVEKKLDMNNYDIDYNYVEPISETPVETKSQPQPEQKKVEKQEFKDDRNYKKIDKKNNNVK